MTIKRYVAKIEIDIMGDDYENAKEAIRRIAKKAFQDYAVDGMSIYAKDPRTMEDFEEIL